MALLAWALLAVVVVAVVIYDLTQRRHAILRNYPIIGHFRYLLEAVGPELRQYIVTDNDEERPFSRDQRRWVYSSAKNTKQYFGFGTDNDPELASSYLIIQHDTLGLPAAARGADEPEAGPLPCPKVLGGARGRRHAFRPRSLVTVSGMSFGSLSGAAVEALNRGCLRAECLHNTGEGGISRHHVHGADLIYQLGTAYFGCRDGEGRFELSRLVEACEAHPVRAIEVKLSQGAKPGVGGLLPAAKITAEIAAARGIPLGRDCASPAAHAEFGSVDEMLDFVERLADATGLPIGIKSAVGELRFWQELARLMADDARGVDLITIDGGEGGTGAGPLVFTDHVALPFILGFARVYALFAERGLQDQVVFQGSGKLGFPDRALLALALGCDLVAVGREAMLAIGCIQAQRCHTGHCPSGVATQSRWLAHGLDPTDKSVRLAHYVETLRKELRRLANACGSVHPSLVALDRLEILDPGYHSRTVGEIFGYRPSWGLPSEEQAASLRELMKKGATS